MLTLAQSSILTSVSIHMMRNNRLDRTVTMEVTANKGAAHGSARVNKSLFDKSSFAPMVTKAGEIRTFQYENTLPWQHDGIFILPARHFETFDETMQRLIREFDETVFSISCEWDQHIARGMSQLGTMARVSDYPTRDQFQRACWAEVAYNKIGDPRDDWRVQMSDQQLERIQKQAIATERDTIAAAQRELWERLTTKVSHMAETLKKYGNGEVKRFNDSLVDNLRDICPTLRGLNFTDDPQLDQMIDAVEKALCPVDADTLRESETAREYVRKQADDILAQMGAMSQSQSA